MIFFCCLYEKFNKFAAHFMDVVLYIGEQNTPI